MQCGEKIAPEIQSVDSVTQVEECLVVDAGDDVVTEVQLPENCEWWKLENIIGNHEIIRVYSVIH